MTIEAKWHEDFLGPEFQAATFALHADSEGMNYTTLIRYMPSLVHDTPQCPGVPGTSGALVDAPLPKSSYSPNRNTGSFRETAVSDAPAHEHAHQRPRFALIALHGWNDYFYHAHFARYIDSIGGLFYALDLRKYGRSWREGQTWGYIDDLSAYDDEIHIALDVIFTEHGPDIPIVLYGHSTGGLTATLWAHRHPGALAGLILNSPWLEIQSASGVRHVSTPAVDAMRKVSPRGIIPISDSGIYQRTLNAGQLDPDAPQPLTSEQRDVLQRAQERTPEDTGDPFFTTGWHTDSRFRHYPSFPVRAGWMATILDGHAHVAQGLDVEAPILVLTSTRSTSPSRWNEDALESDTVLLVEQIWRRAPFLGNNVTLAKIPYAIHDVLLSRRSARTHALDTIHTWLTAILHTQTEGAQQRRHV
ncbi:MAG: alpha/beta hydrolase [Actinomycetaceae bacterium]|nr:alpha/beta hydrolase [Arcanobacterium sp.]MDD7504925.1 alpha/beta hydrolase [Actinomycetaceae bacterium]MDY6143271.1 alpha/beta hydrolase [Arcanobacterium sp.]